MPRLRCAYLDLDGTLLGRGASLMHDGEGRPTLLGARAIEACLRADVEVVLVSGRRAVQLAEDSRLLGQRAYVFEAGAGLVVDGETMWATGDFNPDVDTTIHDQITASGAPALLLEHFAGRLEYHDPWHRDREVSHLFRGLVDAFEADELLTASGHDGPGSGRQTDYAARSGADECARAGGIDASIDAHLLRLDRQSPPVATPGERRLQTDYPAQLPDRACAGLRH